MSTNGAHVLVVDDEPQILRGLKVILRSAGFQVDTAATKSEALDAVAARPPDAVVLDLVLPDGSGVEVCRELRSWSQLPVIVLSAVGDEREKVRALDAGADDYVTKPFGVDELMARLRSQLRRRSGHERFQVADLVLEPATRLVRRGGRDIALTAQEFSLLELLMRHPNQVLTRSQILDHVWGYDARRASNVVDTYVHYLRAKIDRGHRRALLATVRSVGYSLRP